MSKSTKKSETPKTIPWQCRQGDVLLEHVGDRDLKPGKVLDRDPGARIVLAHGEATGHAHVVLDRRAKLHELIEDRSAVGDAVWANLVGLLRAPKGATLKHDCPGQVKPDHDPIPLPAGDYVVTTQLQYTPEAIVPVAD